nr:unnamed protein product [Callosobruchus chinensis]
MPSRTIIWACVQNGHYGYYYCFVKQTLVLTISMSWKPDNAKFFNTSQPIPPAPTTSTFDFGISSPAFWLTESGTEDTAAIMFSIKDIRKFKALLYDLLLILFLPYKTVLKVVFVRSYIDILKKENGCKKTRPLYHDSEKFAFGKATFVGATNSIQSVEHRRASAWGPPEPATSRRYRPAAASPINDSPAPAWQFNRARWRASSRDAGPQPGKHVLRVCAQVRRRIECPRKRWRVRRDRQEEEDSGGCRHVAGRVREREEATMAPRRATAAIRKISQDR